MPATGHMQNVSFIVPGTIQGANERPMRGNFIQIKVATGVITVLTDKNEYDFLVVGEWTRFDKDYTNLSFASSVPGETISVTYGYGIKNQAGGPITITGTPSVKGQFANLTSPAYASIFPFIGGLVDHNGLGAVQSFTSLYSGAPGEDIVLSADAPRQDFIGGPAPIGGLSIVPGTNVGTPITYDKQMVTFYITGTAGDVAQINGSINGSADPTPTVYDLNTGVILGVGSAPIPASGILTCFVFTEGFSSIGITAPALNVAPLVCWASASEACRVALPFYPTSGPFLISAAAAGVTVYTPILSKPPQAKGFKVYGIFTAVNALSVITISGNGLNPLNPAEAIGNRVSNWDSIGPGIPANFNFTYSSYPGSANNLFGERFVWGDPAPAIFKIGFTNAVAQQANMTIGIEWLF